jgi:hypothetical protein
MGRGGKGRSIRFSFRLRAVQKKAPDQEHALTKYTKSLAPDQSHVLRRRPGKIGDGKGPGQGKEQGRHSRTPAGRADGTSAGPGREGKRVRIRPCRAGQEADGSGCRGSGFRHRSSGLFRCRNPEEGASSQNGAWPGVISGRAGRASAPSSPPNAKGAFETPERGRVRPQKGGV